MTMTATSPEFGTKFHSGYANVNGIDMYYEIYGEGKPLVLIHGGGSTIQSTFETVIPGLASRRQVIAVELQAHGRTSDRDKPLSFEQDADDVSALLSALHVDRADFLGFSNGANTTMQIAIRHPEKVSRIILVSGFYKRDGMIPGFWDMMRNSKIEDMPVSLKEAFLRVTPDTAKFRNLFNRCSARMNGFADWDEAQIHAIKAPTLVIAGDRDVMTPEHTTSLFRLIPNSRLTILPGAHGEFMGEQSSGRGTTNIGPFVDLVSEFLLH